MTFEEDFPGLIEDCRGLIQERNLTVGDPNTPVLVAFPPAAIQDCCLDKQRVKQALRKTAELHNDEHTARSIHFTEFEKELLKELGL